MELLDGWMAAYSTVRLKAFREGGRTVYDTIDNRRRRLGLAAQAAVQVTVRTPQTLITVNLVKKTTPSVTDSEETGTDPLEIAREIAMGVILRPRNRYDQ